MNGSTAAVAVLGGLVGAAAWTVYDALAAGPPDRQPVPRRAGVRRATLPAQQPVWSQRLAGPLVAALARAGVGVPRRVLPDLPICGRTPDRHQAEKTTAALLGLLLPPLLAQALPLAGTGRAAVPLWAGGAAVLAAAGWLAPDLAVAAQARARRRDARHALSAFLDLTVIGLAGGAGVEQALGQAAGTGTHPTLAAVRHALHHAVARHQPLWTPLDDLGATLGLTELRELAASLRLAGTEGATIRRSLTAKAATLRTRLLADTESAAQAATERMSLPLAVMFAGFLLFITYPALTQALTGL
jgi:tight adherence protein C